MLYFINALITIKIDLFLITFEHYFIKNKKNINVSHDCLKSIFFYYNLKNCVFKILATNGMPFFKRVQHRQQCEIEKSVQTQEHTDTLQSHLITKRLS